MDPVRTKLKRLCSALRVFLCLGALLATVQTSFAFPPLNTACPLNFFTNVAARLLSAQLNVNPAHIQIYPTNQYTPAVHRLLQVTANIYDATTTNYYPSVFRPVFWKTNELNSCGVTQTDLYIAGYQYVQEPLTVGGPPIFNPPQDAADPAIPFGLSATNNIYGIPWVLGVKKGLPNFNGLEIENYFYIQRQLQFNRNSIAIDSTPGATFPYGRAYTTNQMYVIGVSNLFAIEHWNSYASTYVNPVTITVQYSLGFALSNLDNPNVPQAQVLNSFYTNNDFAPSGPTNFADWPGYSSAYSTSFVLPIGTNAVMQNLGPPGCPPSLTNTYVYYYGPGAITLNGFSYQSPCFIPASVSPGNFLDQGTPPLPHWIMMTTNRLWAYMLDTENPQGTYILDYVQLGGMNSSLDVNAAIADPDNTGLWSTNTDYNGGGAPPFGVLEQFLVSIAGGAIPVVDNDSGPWPNANVPGVGSAGPAAQQDYFTAFFSAQDNYEGVTNIALSVQAPYTPMRLVCQSLVYQANDPLVHYLSSDLYDYHDSTNGFYRMSLPPPTLKYLGHLSDRYMPWGSPNLLPPVFVYNNEAVPTDQNPFNLAYKDPLVYDADDWDFPTNETLNASWLGQVHRGTPWQTIFLKSTNILDLTSTLNGDFNVGLSTWQLWTGDTNPADAYNMAPVMDWRMAGLLASLFNTNNIATLFSVNNPSAAAWENLLNGMTVLTNDVADGRFNFRLQPAQFATVNISSSSAQAAAIASAVQSARVASPGQIIADVGDIFAVPQLSDASPYLNVDAIQTQYGISDIAYEAIPDQLLPLLWENSIGQASATGGQMVIQFSGDDDYAYAVQSSCDLVHWNVISTNCPVNGIFTFTNTATGKARFYRTVLIQ